MTTTKFNLLSLLALVAVAVTSASNLRMMQEEMATTEQTAGPTTDATTEATIEQTKEALQTEAFDPPTTSNTTSEPASDGGGGSDAWPAWDAGRVYDFTTESGVDFNYCTSMENGRDKANHHIFLLHGASFSKKIWSADRTGILDDFCSSPGIRVSALNLPVSANFTELQVAIEEVETVTRTWPGDKIQPVVLVTPSASGWSMVSAMVSDNVGGLWKKVPKFIDVWVPVATGSLERATDKQIAGAVFENDIPVLAIYGRNDTEGKQLSRRLGMVGQEFNGTAKVLELERGGHSIYIQRPLAFVREIIDFIIVNSDE